MVDHEVATEIQEVALAESEAARYRLTVTNGPDRGREIVVAPSDPLELLIGQSPACQLRVFDPKVSRRHVAVETVGTRLKLRDVGSKNGTTVGGISIVEAYLRGGEQVVIGETTIAVTREDGTVSQKDAPPINFGSIVMSSRAMRRLEPLLSRIASSQVPVLIEGETGTGKEVVARAIHESGPRSHKPFIVFDCSAVAPTVIESELFGHERGAFTGAIATRKGLFEQAHGGTLFIDEIAELPLDLQPRLLRALERSEVRRIGGSAWLRCDVRVVAATRRDIDAYVQQGRFRDDLFHRLAVGRVVLPPLRQRVADIPLLVAQFAREVDSDAPPIPARVVDDWIREPWPGNVRQLRNAVFRHLALGDLDIGDESDAVASPDVAQGESEIDAVLRLRLPYPKARDRMARLFVQRYVDYMVAACGGSVQKAAQASGVALRYFQLLRARRNG